MPLREETIDLEEEIARLEAEREDLLDALSGMDRGTTAFKQKLQRGQDLDAHLDGLEWAVDAHEDEDVPAWNEDVDTVTLGGLTAGEYGKLEADLAEANANSNQSAAGAQRVYQVRAGTVNAPYLDPSASDGEQLRAVASLPVGFLKWVNDRIDDLSSVGNGERKSFSESLAERSER